MYVLYILYTICCIGIVLAIYQNPIFNIFLLSSCPCYYKKALARMKILIRTAGSSVKST